jgi:hypothetical protein
MAFHKEVGMTNGSRIASSRLRISSSACSSRNRDSARPARWLSIHARDGGFAAFMRGVRDGVEVEWDISAVPPDGGLPASEAIVRS